MTSLMAFIRRHVLLFGVVKFCAGLVIEFRGIFSADSTSRKRLEYCCFRDIVAERLATGCIYTRFAQVRWAALGRWGDHGEC